MNALRRRNFSAFGLTAALCGFAAPHAAAQGSGRRIVVLGDSLSAEYGLARGTGWVALLDKRLTEQSIAARVVNASVSGETTFGARARLAAVLAEHRPTHLIIELGGNDALRGLALNATRDNLIAMTQTAQRAGSKVLLLGMQVPPNYGASYAAQFSAIFAQVAEAQRVPLVPFFLKGVADGPEPLKLFQADRIHPNEQAQPAMLGNVWPALKRML